MLHIFANVRGQTRNDVGFGLAWFLLGFRRRLEAVMCRPMANLSTPIPPFSRSAPYGEYQYWHSVHTLRARLTSGGGNWLRRRHFVYPREDKYAPIPVISYPVTP